MRVSMDSFRRWWAHRDGEGQANGGGDGRFECSPVEAAGDHSAVPRNGDKKKANGSRWRRAPGANGSSAAMAVPVPVEPPWVRRLDREGIPRTLQYPTAPVGRLLDQTADRFGDAQAIAYHDARWTYGELLAQVNRLAGGLACLGVRRGDRVLMALPTCPEFVTTFFAVQKLGAVVVNAGPLMGLDDLREVIRLARPRVVVGMDLRAGHLLQAAAGQDAVEHFVWTSLQTYQTRLKWVGYQFKLWQGRDRAGGGGGADHVTMGELLQHAPSRPPTVAPELDQTAVLQPTGGTTGTLKLARLTHRALLANCTQVVSWMNLRYGQERVLAVLPMFHIYGLMLGLLAGVFSASQLILLTRFDGPETLRLLREHRVTIFPMVPAICDALGGLLAGEERREPLRDLRLCFSGAAPLPPEAGERFRRLSGSCVIEGYGLTEASPVTHAGLPGDPRPGSIGLPLPDTRVRVADLDTGHDVEAGACGELLVSGPQVMSGYFGDPEQTRIALQPDADGTVWLHTGDVVRYDGDGFFQVVDRRKDMINHSGLKVFPSRVERVLRADERVKEVAVLGRPDPVMTERVVAVVVPAAPPEDAMKLGQELRAICREHLAPYEVPADVEFVGALPRTGLGKLLRKDLRTAQAGGVLVTGDSPGTNATGPARPEDPEPPVGPAERPVSAAKEVTS